MEETSSRRTVASPRELIPFVVASVLAWSTTPIGTEIDWGLYWLSLAFALLGGFLVAVDRPRLPYVNVALRAGCILGGVALLRASAGGVSAGIGVVSLLPVFYVALYRRSRIDLVIVLAEVAAMYLLPIVLIGAPDYPDTQYRAALLTITVGTIVGFVTQRLVENARDQRAVAESRGDMLEQVSVAVHELFASSTPRDDVCRAVTRIAKASSAMLCEPTSEPGGLDGTAHCGLLSDAVQPSMDRGGRLAMAMQSGRRILVDDECWAEFDGREQWQSAGSPGAILYQPMVSRGATVGLLVVAWSGEVGTDSPKVTVAALLAHEAAAVIERADHVAMLSDEAHTDALTGLPNRRAWARRLAERAREGGVLTLCVLDLDRFKAFNDAYGHPAGDLLLRETAAAWRDELRGDDFLARIGGEEFGLLLDTGQTGDALEVVERLRRRVAGGQTCSAGVAVGRPGENPDALVSRADRALYAAKQAGRDRVVVDSGDASEAKGASRVDYPCRPLGQSREVRAPTPPENS